MRDRMRPQSKVQDVMIRRGNRMFLRVGKARRESLKMVKLGERSLE